MAAPDFLPGLGVTAVSAGQTYNLNDGREIRLEMYDLGMAPARRLWQRAPGQNGRTNLGAVGEPRFVDLAWRLTGRDLPTFYGLRETLQTVFRMRQNQPVQLVFDFPGGVQRALDLYLDGQLLFSDRAHTTTLVSGTFVADDPRLYDPARRSVTFALLDSSGGLPIPFTVPIPIGQDALNTIETITYAGASRLAAEEYPVIIIGGPLSSPVVENLTTGEQIALTANGGLALDVGEFVTIDLSGGSRRDAKTLRDQAGNSVSQYLSTDSDIATFHLAYAGELLADGSYADGTNLIRVTGSDANLLTLVELRYYDRYEGI